MQYILQYIYRVGILNGLYSTYTGNPFNDQLVSVTDPTDIKSWTEESLRTLEGSGKAFYERKNIYESKNNYSPSFRRERRKGHLIFFRFRRRSADRKLEYTGLSRRSTIGIYSNTERIYYKRYKLALEIDEKYDRILYKDVCTKYIKQLNNELTKTQEEVR